MHSFDVDDFIKWIHEIKKSKGDYLDYFELRNRPSRFPSVKVPNLSEITDPKVDFKMILININVFIY